MIIEPTPREAFPDLFEAVQLGRLFSDSKTFVDAVPRNDPAAIYADFHDAKDRPGFDLRNFVERHFELPPEEDTADGSKTGAGIAEHIRDLWDILTREPDERARYSSLIPLPRPYVVPGGRFREIYYWDSYFTMLGLAEAGHVGRIRDMVDNFAYLIDQVGFIPNGNRSYFCSRSQPPYFSLMVELLGQVSGEPCLPADYQPQLLREYEFWMAGADSLGNGVNAHRRVVAANGACLNPGRRATPKTSNCHHQPGGLPKICIGTCARDASPAGISDPAGWAMTIRWPASARRGSCRSISIR